MNLFLLVTLTQYEEFHKKPENPIEKFEKIVYCFKVSWNMFSTEEDKGFKIKQFKLTNFLLSFNIDFMDEYRENLDSVNKYIFDLSLYVDDEGYVYFYDTLFKILKKEFGNNMEHLQIIVEEEKKIIKILNDRTKRMINILIKEKEKSQKKNIGNKVSEYLKPSIKKKDFSMFIENNNHKNSITPYLLYKLSFYYLLLYKKKK